MAVYASSPSAEDAEIEDPWGLLGSQPSLLVKLQARERSPQKIRWLCKEQHLRLTSGLHMHLYTCTRTHVNAQTCTHHTKGHNSLA